jgi:transcription antitermination factor NusG
VFTKSHHEKSVSHHFKQRGIEDFLPLYREVHHWTNRRHVRVDLPLFPNYIFVHVADNEERVRVLESPGVLRIVSRGRDPIPLSDFEIETLRTGLHQRAIEPHPYLVVGERVRIKSGPLAGLQGVLLRKSSNLRVVLTVDQIMRSISAEVDASEVEPADPNPLASAVPHPLGSLA